MPHPIEALAYWRARECEPYRVAAHAAAKAYDAAKGRDARKSALLARKVTMRAFGDAMARAHTNASEARAILPA